MFSKEAFPKVLFIIAIATTLLWSQYRPAKSSVGPGLAVTASDPVWGSPFNISTGTIDETSPRVVYNSVDKEFLVVWENMRAVPNDIYAQRISEKGEFISWFYVADGEAPVVAYNEKQNSYLVVYYKEVGGDYDVYARRVDYTGPTHPEFPVAWMLHDNERFPAVDYNTHPSYDEYLVVWEIEGAATGSTKYIEGYRVAGTAGGGDAGGELIGSRLSISVGSNWDHEPDVAYNLNMNEFLTVYTRIGTSDDVMARRVAYDPSQNVVLLPETTIDASPEDQFNPSVAAYRLNHTTPYLVVFSDTWNDSAIDVRGYLVDQGAQPNTLVNIATAPGQRELEPAIAHSESWGGYVVTWIQGPPGDTDVFGMKVNDNGFTHPEFDVANYGTSPTVCDRGASDVAVGNVAAIAVWRDSCGVAGGLDILGRMLGFRVYLPLTVR
jgi:hypothetical protein